MPSVCFGERARCVDLFKQKEFNKAADCFENTAKKLGDSASLSSAVKSEKGQYLRNAAAALDKAATKEKQSEIAAFLRERAIQLLQQYQKEQLFETDNRKLTALAQQTSIHKKIGYASLAIVTNSDQATILLEGYRFAQRATGNWNQSMRPGPYKITVTYQGKPSIIREIRVLANKPHIEIFQPTSSVDSPDAKGKPPNHSSQLSQKLSQPPSPAMPMVSWIGYIGGGVMAVAGSIMLGVGASQWFAINSEYENNKQQQTPADYDALMGRREHAQRFIWPGTALLGTGVILAIVGTVAHTTTPRQTQATPQTSVRFPREHTQSKRASKTSTQSRFEYILW
jgi:hypothetical protein